MGDFQTDLVRFNLNFGTKPYVSQKDLSYSTRTNSFFQREVECLVELGVPKSQPHSEWGSPAFMIAKKNDQFRILTDFRKVNKRIVQTPWLIPKISDVIQELMGFTFETSIDLNIGYWTIRLDPDAHKICTIVLPRGKYLYMHLLTYP